MRTTEFAPPVTETTVEQAPVQGYGKPSVALPWVVLLYPGQEPQLYLIPATAWREPNALLVDREYEGLKSAPEWGLNLSEKNAPLLAGFVFGTMVEQL
jgi:hypothetical protein